MILNKKIFNFKFKILLIVLFCGLIFIRLSNKDNDEYLSEINNLEVHFNKNKAFFKKYGISELNQREKYKIILGKYLFFSKSLSLNNTKSCISCHDPKYYFTDGYKKSIGALGNHTEHNSPSILNVITRHNFNWKKSQINTLEMQMHGPLFKEKPIELGNKIDSMIPERITNNLHFKKLYYLAYNERDYNWNNIINAIVSFEKMLISVPKNQITNDVLIGKQIFESEKYHCSKCHGGEFLNNKISNHYLQNNSHNFKNLLNKNSINSEYNIPSLINVANTSPYFHDGSADNLFQLINSDSLCQKMTLFEKKALIDYLYFFSDTSVLNNHFYQKLLIRNN